MVAGCKGEVSKNIKTYERSCGWTQADEIAIGESANIDQRKKDNFGTGVFEGEF
jgi:hypothetical protein